MYYWKVSPINFVWVQVTWRSRWRWGFPKQVATPSLLARARAQGQISVMCVFQSLDRIPADFAAKTFSCEKEEDKMVIWKKGFICGDWCLLFEKECSFQSLCSFPFLILFFLSQSLSFPFSPFNIFFADLSQSFSPAVHPPNVSSPSHWPRLVTEKYSEAICSTCI